MSSLLTEFEKRVMNSSVIILQSRAFFNVIWVIWRSGIMEEWNIPTPPVDLGGKIL
jgi:hypothetical protein